MYCTRLALCDFSFDSVGGWYRKLLCAMCGSFSMRSAILSSHVNVSKMHIIFPQINASLTDKRCDISVLSLYVRTIHEASSN